MALVNLYSDTQTRPTAAMRAAIAAAEVGDEQRGADPTTRALEERVAALLGHEAAVFLPSGTMCNEIAIRLHIRPGGERMFIGRDTHPLIAEAGGPAQLSGAVITEVDGDSGMFTAAGARATRSTAPGPAGATGRASAWCPSSRRRTWAAGACGRSSRCAACSTSPAASGLATHLDGARLMNAVVASGVDAADWAERLRQRVAGLHQGPGRPGGRVPGRARRRSSRRRGAGSRCWAAPCASRASSPPPASTRSTTTSSAWPTTTRAPGGLAEGLAALPGVELDPATVQTNIVIFAVPDAAAFTAALAAEDVAMSHFGPTRVRAVTHLDVDDAGIDRALAVAAQALG